MGYKRDFFSLPGNPCHGAHRRRLRAMLAMVTMVVATFSTSESSRAETIGFEGSYKGRTIKIEGELRKPSGPGPFPVVIGLHACDGPTNYSTNFWLTTLAAQGYATYLPNSFGPRGYIDVCARTSWVTAEERAHDALLAATALAMRPDIRGDKIALLGVSHGGGGVSVASREDPSLLSLREKLAGQGERSWRAS